MTSNGPASVTRLVAAFSSFYIRTILIPIMRGSGQRESSLRKVLGKNPTGRSQCLRISMAIVLIRLNHVPRARPQFDDVEAVVSVQQNRRQAESHPQQAAITGTNSGLPGFRKA